MSILTFIKVIPEPTGTTPACLLVFIGVSQEAAEGNDEAILLFHDLACLHTHRLAAQW